MLLGQPQPLPLKSSPTSENTTLVLERIPTTDAITASQKRTLSQFKDSRIRRDFRVIDEQEFCGQTRPKANTSKQKHRSTTTEPFFVCQIKGTSHVFSSKKDLDGYPPNIPKKNGVVTLSRDIAQDSEDLHFSQGLPGTRGIFKDCRTWSEYKCKMNSLAKDQKYLLSRNEGDQIVHPLEVKVIPPSEQDQP